MADDTINELRVLGVSRESGRPDCLSVAFNRFVTDEELREVHDTLTVIYDEFDGDLAPEDHAAIKRAREAVEAGSARANLLPDHGARTALVRLTAAVMRSTSEAPSRLTRPEIDSEWTALRAAAHEARTAL